jgi:hypothetical protein
VGGLLLVFFFFVWRGVAGTGLRVEMTAEAASHNPGRCGRRRMVALL